MPLTGGPADKAGNSYERRWTVLALLDVLAERAQSVRLEVPGDEGAGFEFRLLVDGGREWHQAKRQRDGGPWTIANMAKESVLAPWWPKIQAGDRVVFVSSTGAQELRELVERASHAATWEEFKSEFITGEQSSRLQRLRSAWDSPPDEAIYAALKSIEVKILGEPELAGHVEARAASLTTGKPSTTAAVLGQLVDDSCHLELTASEVWERLAASGITPRNLSHNEAIKNRIAEIGALHISRIRRLYIGGRELWRKEADEAFSHLVGRRNVLISGTAGGGKSVIAAQVADLARRDGWTVLVLAVDRLPDAETTSALGTALGLRDSPLVVLAGVACREKALLVLDQLDAVSAASGRHPERFSVVEDLLSEASRHPSLQVLLACRQFDLDNDRSLRAVTRDERTAIVTIGALDLTVLQESLVHAGLSINLPDSLLDLLTVPLHLAIYVEIAKSGIGDVSAARSLTNLYDKYWDVKHRACRKVGEPDDWLAAIDRLVERMSVDQKLTVPAAVLDAFDRQINVMASESVLVKEDGRISFFHETFFDYCFARRLVSAGKTVHTLLCNEEQDLFRRAQVRQFLNYERAVSFPAYLLDLKWLLTSDDVRLHIKALVVALAQDIVDPQAAEWIALRPIATNPTHLLHNRLWQALRRNPMWFPIVREAGDWTTLLSASDPAVVNLTLWALTGMTSDYSEEISPLLRAMSANEAWPSRLRWFLRLADIRAGRPLFDLLLESVQAGFYDGDSGEDLWHALRKLVDKRPAWVIEVLASLLARALATGAANPFEGLGPLTADRNSLAGETVHRAAQCAPAAFVEELTTYILEVARRNAEPEWSGGDVLLDSVWTSRHHGSLTDIKGAFFSAMESALRDLAIADPSLAESMFVILMADPHASAWILLAQGYTSNPNRFADDAASWLTLVPGALNLGRPDKAYSFSRELIAAITPHCGDAQLGRLSSALIGYMPPSERGYEGLNYRGRGELCLLNAIDPRRRSDLVRRRLEELRRKFLVDDVNPPREPSVGAVPPPIPEEKARKMTDMQWLKAMARHNSSDVGFQDARLIGGAGTQSQVLESLTRESPPRFAQLLLRLPADVAEPYLGGILRGLAGSRLDVDLLLAVCQHAREIGGSETNRWVVRLIEAEAAAKLSDQLLDIVAEIATLDPDPATDTWSAGEPGAAQMYGGDPDFAGLNRTRGAAALAIGELIHHDPARLPRLAVALASVAADPTIEVRAMASVALTSTLYVDHTLALTLFNTCVADGVDVLLASGHVENFLNRTIRLGHYISVAGVLAGMRVSTNPDVLRASARQLAVASYRDPDIDPLVDAALAGDEISRVGVVEVFADNFPAPDRRDRAVAILRSAFTDPSSEVRAAAVRCFHRMENQQLGDLEPLFSALASSPSLHEHASILFHVLESARQPLPEAVLELCERFVQTCGENMNDISTEANLSATSIVQLAIRLHAQHSDPDTRRRCLDLIDQLVEFDIHGLDASLLLVERR